MHLILGDQDQYRSNTLIPKQPVQPYNLRRFNPLNLTEVNDRRLLQAEDAVQLEFFKGAP
jgi:hypothetical protein